MVEARSLRRLTGLRYTCPPDILQLLVALRNKLPRAGAAPADGGNDDEQQYVTDVDFGSVQGKRYLKALEMLMDPDCRFSLVLLSLVLEPLRTVTSWLMRRAKEAQGEHARPRTLDFFCESRSYVTFSLQYLASLLAGANDRWILVYKTFGCDSLAHWYQTERRQLRSARRSILVAVAWLERRFAVRRSFPWKLVSLADERLPESERETLWRSFLDMTPCCLPAGLARKLHNQAKTTEGSDQWFNSAWWKCFWWFSVF